MECDFRFQKDALKGLQYSICGLGNSLYEENFNKIAIEIDKCFSNLQATRIAPLYLCDENTIKSKHSSLEGDVSYWQNNFFEKLDYFTSNKAKVKEDSCCQNNEASSCCKQTDDSEKLKNGNCCSNKSDEEEKKEDENGYADSTEDEEDAEDDEEANYFSDIDEDLNGDENGVDNDLVKVKKQKNGLIDMEDLGTVMSKMKKMKNVKSEPKEMITPLLLKSLEKQGYKLIGTHSGVKLVILKILFFIFFQNQLKPVYLFWLNLIKFKF